MPGLFISHSSIDKPFVERFAIDLVNRGFPVWFDTWEMDTGDSLHDKIYTGIDESDYLIVVLSPNSVGSDWVRKELEAALAVEGSSGRKFVLPVRIADCEIPHPIADRLYADFSSKYLEPLERFVDRLGRMGLGQVAERPEHALVPLVFEKGIYLDGVQLERRVDGLLHRLPADFESQANQLLVAPDEQYAELRRRLIERKEHIVDDPYYSPAFARDFSLNYNLFFEEERRLVEGLLLIVNAYVANQPPSLFDVGVACEWFARLGRIAVLYLLHTLQNPDQPDRIDYLGDFGEWGLGSDETKRRLLEREEVCVVAVGPGLEGHGGALARFADQVRVVIDANSSEARSIEEAVMCLVEHVRTSELYSKYLIPQIVRRHMTHPESPVTCTFDGWYIGPY